LESRNGYPFAMRYGVVAISMVPLWCLVSRQRQ